MKTSVKVALKIGLVVLATSIMAQLTFDLNIAGSDIPISGQSLAVMIGCIFLSPRDAIIAMLGYLLLGVVGMPVFADASSGIDKLTGGSSGFLFGFVITGYVMAFLGKRGFSKSFNKALCAMFIGSVVLLVCGNVVLIYKYGFNQGLTYGFYPFWLAAIIKAFIGAILIWLINKYIRKT